MHQKLPRLFAGVLLCSFFYGCQKPRTNPSAADQNQALINAARHFIEQQTAQAVAPTGNPRIDDLKSPYWEVAQVVNTSKGSAVLVPIYYQQDLVVTTTFSGRQILPLNQITRLLVYKTESGYQVQVLTSFPDTSSQNVMGSFSGIVFLEGWHGQPVARYSISGNQVLVETVDTGINKGLHSSIQTDNAITNEGIEAQCGTIDGYNYSPALPGETNPWSESVGCDYSSTSSPGNPSLLSNGEYASLVRLSIGKMSGLTTVELSPPANVIGNIADYLQCFSNYGGDDHTYQVTVCVDQPIPGSRTPWATVPDGIAGSSSAANPVDAGHTWLVLTETFGSYSIVRNVGFYPQSNVYPWSASAQGALGDDDGHSYNVSLTVTVDNGQFYNILSYVSQGSSPGFLYNLNTNNCSTFAINALAAGNVTLPSTKSTWPDGGFGNDPGDLGQDIENMPLSDGMTRGNSYTALPNKYNCN